MSEDKEERAPEWFSKVKSAVVDTEVPSDKKVEEKKEDIDYTPLERNGVAFEVILLFLYLAIASFVILSPFLKSPVLSLNMCLVTVLFLLPAFPVIFSIAGLMEMPKGLEYAEGRVFYFTKNNLTVTVLIHLVIVGVMAWSSLRGLPSGF
jgi:hypothetical protein